MSKFIVAIAVMLLVLPLDALAQRGGRGGRGGGGGGRNSGGSSGSPQRNNPKDDASESRPTKQTGDLAAASISGQWKDAKTLEVTGTVKNQQRTPFSGNRTITLSVTFKDGHTEVVQTMTIFGVDGGETQAIVFSATDKKYFDKELKWTLEISAGDTSASNDKKSLKLTLAPQPKG